jgi:hypothetical protein
MTVDKIRTAEIEVTPAMKDVGARVILAEDGVADQGVFFSAPDLAARVFSAMEQVRPQPHRFPRHNPARRQRRRGTT